MVDGNLISVQPLQTVCFDNPASNTCQETISRSEDGQYLSDQPGAMVNPFRACTFEGAECCWYEPNVDNECQQGEIPLYAVDAKTSEHV